MRKQVAASLIWLGCWASCQTPALAAELLQITPENYQDVVPQGKEVDAIYGDWVLRNNLVTAVIANTVPGRKANMTVRGVGGMLIDYTTRFNGSDQLSCFYPGGGRYLFEESGAIYVQSNPNVSDALVAIQPRQQSEITLVVVGVPVANDGTVARVSYTLRDKQNWLDYSVEITNRAETAQELRIEDSLRCDGNLFETGTLESGLFYAEDRYFGQCYGFSVDGHKIQRQGGRGMQLQTTDNQSEKVAPGDRFQWSGSIFCSQGLPGIHSQQRAKQEGIFVEKVQLLLKNPQGPIAHARVEYLQDGKSLGMLQTTEDGFVRTELPSGNYVARVDAIGLPQREHPFSVDNRSRADTLTFVSASRVRANITDAIGEPIAAKVQFIGLEGTSDPDYGPDSAIAAIKNVVYCARGSFEIPIDAGKYRVIISHGPEFDAEIRAIEVLPGQLTQITCSLPRVVDTAGWISSEFHSHSTPSGDNVSHQTGRVLNLLAEHLEFAPCTEHNRIDTYADDLAKLGAEPAMATCTGMELTGGPLPINHQNAFPMVHHEHQQDGGAPQSDADPVKQIERLALWDQGSPKVVQTNHPNIPSILGDRDLDGKPDGGFRGMLGWMDVIEVHPPEGIFTPPTAEVTPDNRRSNPIFYWLQLLNLGYRIPGVVNTDAHYNFHGSGWLRNYMRSSTDIPAEISVAEMVHAAEHGHMIMTTGPFLESQVRVQQDGTQQSYISGDDVPLGVTESKLWIRVQCPNWFDINRVQVFANGRPVEHWNFTRGTHPTLFHDEVVRFEMELDLPAFPHDTHLIVATLGEGLQLGPVMGTERGELPPVAVSNPIFLDIDGSGFQANGDDLGVPFLLETPE